tara:strand:+ start:4848 stop:7985 length:3138 start_codon:yes stop_codon:yes gene_type:complete
MKFNKKLIGMCILILMVIVPTSIAISTYFDTASVSRVVGDSPSEILRQMRRDELNINYVSYHTDRNGVFDKELILSKQFGDNAKGAIFKQGNNPGFTFSTVTDTIQTMDKNELIVLEPFGNSNPLTIDGYHPRDIRPWQLSIEENNPLIILDAPYAGAYLPKEDTFITRLARDATVIAPTSFNTPQFTKSVICQLFDGRTIGDVFREAKNFHANGGSDNSYENFVGLILQSYTLYGNPMQVIDMRFKEHDQAKIKSYCNNFLRNLAPNIEFIETVGNYSKFRKHLIFEIPNHNLESLENFQIINADNTFQDYKYGELVLPTAIRTTNFPRNTLFTDFRVDNILNPIDLEVPNIPTYEIDLVEKSCYNDYKEHSINFENSFTPTSQDLIAKINPVEVINCTTGQMKLYTRFEYSIDYIPITPILVDNIISPAKTKLNELTTVTIQLLPLTDEIAPGSVAILDKNNNKIWEQDVISDQLEYTATFNTPPSEGLYEYTVEYIEDNQTLSFDSFTFQAVVLEADATIPLSVQETQDIILNLNSHSDSDLDLTGRFYLYQSGDLIDDGSFSTLLTPGSNRKTLTFSGLLKIDQSYILTLELFYLDQTKTLSYVLNTNNVPIIIAPIEDSYTELDEIIINYTVEDHDGDDLTIEINDTRFTEEDGYFTWQTLMEDQGQVNVEITASDGLATTSQILVLQINNNTNESIRDIDGDGIPDHMDPDADNDGVLDSEDSVVGDTEAIESNIENLGISIGGSSDLSQPITGQQNIQIEDNGNTLLEFDFDFDSNNLELNNIEITKQPAEADQGMLVINGINLPEGQTKTVFVDKINSTSEFICIKDIEDVTSITQSCFGENEIPIYCDGQVYEGYTCTDLGNQLRVDGLKHSGIQEAQEIDADFDNFNNQEDCNDNNPSIYPGAEETCNGQDDNCDNIIDEGCIGSLALVIRNNGINISWFDNYGNLYLKENMAENSDYQTSNTDQLIIRNNNIDVFTIDKDGNLYLKEYLYPNQPTIEPVSLYDFIIVNTEAQPIALVNESGSLFLTGDVVENTN